MESAVYASVNWHTKEKFRELRRLVGKPIQNLEKEDNPHDYE